MDFETDMPLVHGFRKDISRGVRKMRILYVRSVARLKTKTGEIVRGRIEDIASIIDPRSYVTINGKEYATSDLLGVQIMYEGNNPSLVLNRSYNNR